MIRRRGGNHRIVISLRHSFLFILPPSSFILFNRPSLTLPRPSVIKISSRPRIVCDYVRALIPQ